jgi:hypothetical protein
LAFPPNKPHQLILDRPLVTTQAGLELPLQPASRARITPAILVRPAFRAALTKIAGVYSSENGDKGKPFNKVSTKLNGLPLSAA